jgi:hypothetical protein
VTSPAVHDFSEISHSVSEEQKLIANFLNNTVLGLSSNRMELNSSSAVTGAHATATAAVMSSSSSGGNLKKK